LEAHFAGKAEAKPFDKESYFCSELVVACFCVIGFVDPSAAIYYNPSTTSPADLGRDATFGSFLGYLTSNKDTTIPKEDEFYGIPGLPKDLGGIAD